MHVSACASRYISEDFGGLALHPVDLIDAATGGRVGGWAENESWANGACGLAAECRPLSAAAGREGTAISCIRCITEHGP